MTEPIHILRCPDGSEFHCVCVEYDAFNSFGPFVSIYCTQLGLIWSDCEPEKIEHHFGQLYYVWGYK